MELNEQAITRALENSLLKNIKDGNVFKFDYNERLDFTPMLRTAYKKIDHARIEKLITENLEEIIAEKVVNKIVTEMGNDIKALMCKAEIREDFKYFLRSGVETILGRVVKKNQQAEEPGEDPEDAMSRMHDEIRRRP